MKLEEFLKQSHSTEGVPFLNASQLLSLRPLPGSTTEKIQKYAISVATTMNIEQTCLKGVRSALEATGVVSEDFFEGLTDAYQAIERFQENDSFVEINCDTENLDMLPPGAIVIWDHGKNNDAPSGHISISKGDGMELSDHICPQNTTGNRPKRNEKYGPKHVFLHKNSFEYVPGLVNHFENRLDTTENKLRAAHILLLFASLSDQNAMRRVIELFFAYQKEISSGKHKDVIAEKKLFVDVVKQMINTPKQTEHNHSLKDTESNPLFKDVHQMFFKFFDSFDNQQQMQDLIAQNFSNPDYITNLKELYKTCNPKNGIRAFMGQDNEIYMYEISSTETTINFGYNSHGDKQVGLCAAIVQLLYKIKDNAEADKDKKDRNLGNEIISILSLYNVFIGPSILNLYNESLELDTQTPPEKKRLFEESLSQQIQLYEAKQKVYKKLSSFKRKLKKGIKLIKNMIFKQKTKQPKSLPHLPSNKNQNE